jgi:hypothetical protein
VSLAIPLSGYYDAVLDLLAGHIGQGGAFLGEPLAVTDEDGAARPYAALYPSPGNRRSVSLSGPSEEVRLTFQVTAAGGDIARALRAIDRVRAALTDVGAASSLACAPARCPSRTATTPARVRHDTALTPSRHYSPLLWTGLIWLPEGGTP